MKRALLWIVTLVSLAALVTACGAGPGRKVSGSAAQSSEQLVATNQRGATEAAPAADKTMGAADGQMNANQASPIGLPADRKLILNAIFDVKVKNADEVISKLTAAVRAAGGYVQETRQQGTREQGRTVNLILRVPGGQYGAITDLVRSQGEVTQQREWTEDVTEQYVDLEERIKTKEIHLSQLQKLYDKGGSIKELMELEQEINRVTSELESMKGRMRVLANRLEFSTITVNLYEPGAPAPIEPPRTVWERTRRGFIQSWNGVINFTGDLFVFVVSALPVLIYLAVVGLILYLIGRPVRRLLRRRANGPSLPPDEEPKA
jgi:hypothetical protein